MDAPLQALIAAAASFGFISFLLGFLVLLCHRHRPTVSVMASDLETSSTQPLPRRSTHSEPSSTSLADESASFDPSLDHISMPELVSATKNFAADGIIGDGSFGFVYKAQLSSGVTVAVKRLSADAFHGFREFRAEMETLGRIRHPNLARMLGFCISGRDRVLIYEFLERGSLDQWLHDPDSVRPGPESDHDSAPPCLSWPTRLEIIRGVAAGLAFLHEECRPSIIHRDIKASNVLLDAEFKARITDFGLARRIDSSRSHVSTQVAGTMGYMPPEYREGATAATAKADVYSFGILMLEVATTRRPNLTVRAEDGKEVGLARWARRMVEEGRGPEILDPLMGDQGQIEEEVRGFLDVACRCTEESSRKRPTMKEVVFDLNQL